MPHSQIKTREELRMSHINNLQQRNNELVKSNMELEQKYNVLVRFAIQTAFNDWNTNVEDLLRILRKLELIKFDEEKQVYINPDYNKDKTYNDLNNISAEKEKLFDIKDDKLDDYTKQLEAKLNKIKEIFKLDLEHEKNKEFLDKIDKKVEE